MKFKYLILTILMLAGFRPAAWADGYFQYPIVPDSVATFQGRCNYLADHFWDFCDLSKAFSARSKMAEEMKVYLSIVANAEPSRGVAGVNALMKKLEKQPKDQLFMAGVAEQLLYGDTAELWIDELYLPIAQSVAANKRLTKAERARFAGQATILENSLVGKRFPALEYVTREGERRNVQADSAEVVVVFFNDPDCSDCALTRVRLDADVSMTQLINEGMVKVVAISLCEPDDEWRESVRNYPSNWIVGAAPDADLTVDLRSGTPDIYLLGRRNTIRYKHLNADQVIDVARQLKRR